MHDALLKAPVLGLYVPAVKVGERRRQGSCEGGRIRCALLCYALLPGHCSKVIDALAAPTLAQKPPIGHGLQLLAP